MNDTFSDPLAVADALFEHCRVYDFAGDDPFDSLNSSLFQTLGLGAISAARIAWLQFHKRSPVNLRRIVGVPRKRNPKGVALIVLGMLERLKLDACPFQMADAISLGDWLLSERCDVRRWKHSAWGYHFDWAARAFFVPKGTPNAITTCYVARALYALGNATGEIRFVDAAVDAGYFLNTLFMVFDGQSYYGYIPGEKAFVHNANLWSAALVSETARQNGDDTLRAQSLRAARQSACMQRSDGAWHYGTRAHHAFVDGFHTGYNLEALNVIARAHGTGEFDEAISRGLDFYRKAFFLCDGTVKYYDSGTWPLDTHSVAQALITLLTVGKTAADRRTADTIYRRAIDTLYMRDKKRFIYQRGRFITNRTDYLRWTQAWAFYSISLFANQVSRVHFPSAKELLSCNA
ncbi:MAG: aspartate-semialdehyde dehydrogenase [Candidatus Pacebacteria bacterium]|nr:aspartate-semialdehyde dehydrogenase [Candidatus Paceibacterota bacterium]